MRRIGLAFIILLLTIQGPSAKTKHRKVAHPPSPIAKEIFGAQKLPSPGAPRAIGSYAKGCIAGAKPLPIDGPSWEVMRLSRNRNWGHPELVSYIERLAEDAKADGWSGLLIGDMAQPMGGPMISGHASHQIGLDADIWLTPMPAKRLTPEERETLSAVSVLANDSVSVDKSIWTPEYDKLIKQAASYPEVARIFVHPAIKKALCDWAENDRAWLSKVRPWWGHNDHFHVRLICPPGSPQCANQPLVGSGDGCGREVESWLRTMRRLVQKPVTPAKPPKPGRATRLSALPAACAALVGVGVKSSGIAVPTEPIPMPERRPKLEGKTARR